MFIKDFRVVCKMLAKVKGQTKSKLFFQADLSSKKTNERIRLYNYDNSGRLVFVRFLEKIEDTKKSLQNYLSFKPGSI